MGTPKNRPKPTDTFGEKPRKRPSHFPSRFTTLATSYHNTVRPCRHMVSPYRILRNVDHLVDCTEKPTEKPAGKYSVRFRFLYYNRPKPVNFSTKKNRKNRPSRFVFRFTTLILPHSATIKAKLPVCTHNSTACSK